jgi:uncharacterized protein YegJ (DUF2314 family)
MFLLRFVFLILALPVILLLRLFGVRRRGIVMLPDDHPEMAAAIQQARETLPEFRRLLASPEPGMAHFGVKARFRVEGGGHEHCWVNDLEPRDFGVSGKLGNQPNSLPNLQLGSSVNVRDDQITDWSYERNGVYQGHFTTKVLLPHLPRKLRHQAETAYGWKKAS